MDDTNTQGDGVRDDNDGVVKEAEELGASVGEAVEEGAEKVVDGVKELADDAADALEGNE